MKSVTLIVKGNLQEATKACIAHDLPRGTGTRINEDSHDCTVTVLPNKESWDSFAKKITEWYCEPIAVIPGKGFPIGSLLHYRFME